MISITEKAAEKINQQLKRRGKGLGIRVVNYAQQDFVFLVDAKSQVYLDGLTIDWIRNGLNEGFEFKNPNERDRCGCGESFRI